MMNVKRRMREVIARGGAPLLQKGQDLSTYELLCF
jgi:hypothetical protein